MALEPSPWDSAELLENTNYIAAYIEVGALDVSNVKC